ncbi:hypothetical protein F5B20DRAFT_527362 [Whalleya microplaca]|nr:hypothetical protein F5B20DRAFT_527362 [Whalleya microplaca]
MNRPGAVPQTLRGMPTGYGGQQQPQQPGRTVSNRLPNGKLANNGGGWAFGGGVPMGGAGLQNSSRQLGGNLSFAQSLSGSQPATPLDLTEFPSLSNNSQLPSANSSSLWSTGGSRSMGGPIQRNQPTPLSQQGQQDEFFSPSRMSSGQGQFRFGNQNNVTQSSQPQPNSIDDFPPLNNSSLRNGNGEIGGERGASLMSSLGFGSQGSTTPGPLQGTRSGNGLLNALSANTRTTDVRSPDGSSAPGITRTQDIRSAAGGNEETRQKPPGFREDSLASQASAQDSAQSADGRNPLGAIGSNDLGSSSGGKTKEKDSQSPSTHDPLAGMAPIDRWGIKGLRTLMNNYPDYNAAVTGLDPTTLGVEITSPAPLSTQILSLFNDSSPRPPVPDYRLPECYNVNNVQALEHKINSFNEETLMWIFYSCPGDIKQHMAASELFNRQWRWHKKLKIWLTKDDIMQPRILSSQHEEGYYIIWNTAEWRKERRTLTLHYADLETNHPSLP